MRWQAITSKYAKRWWSTNASEPSWRPTVTDDIVTRLRIIHCAADDLTPCGTCLICQAADEIERLYNEINDLRLQIVALSLPQQVARG